MTTVSADEGQVPLLMSHWKEFAPMDSAVTADDSSVDIAGVPVPVISVHNPFPVSGVFPANVADDEHSV